MRKLAIVLFMLIFAQSLSATQYARTDSDISNTNWSVAPLWQKIDEVTPSDADEIQSASIASTAVMGLSNVTDPESAVSHLFKYRVKRFAAACPNITVYLMQGAATIASWSQALSTSYVTYSKTLSAGEANAISNYNDLRFKIYRPGGGEAAAACSWFEFSCPDYVPPPPYTPNKVIIITYLCIAFVGFRFINKS